VKTLYYGADGKLLFTTRFVTIARSRELARYWNEAQGGSGPCRSVAMIVVPEHREPVSVQQAVAA
jgi:hypothetical protein